MTKPQTETAHTLLIVAAGLSLARCPLHGVSTGDIAVFAASGAVFLLYLWGRWGRRLARRLAR